MAAAREKSAEVTALEIIMIERKQRFDLVMLQIGAWTNDDLDWLIGELEAGNIAPPIADVGPPCEGCGVPTQSMVDGHPMCEACRPDDGGDVVDEDDGGEADEEAASDDEED